MLNDEVVDKVRGVRDRFAAKHGYDLKAVFADLKASEAARVANGHPVAINAAVDAEPPLTQRFSRFASVQR